MKDQTVDFVNCSTHAVQRLFDELPNGVPSIDLTPLDPLFLPRVAVSAPSVCFPGCRSVSVRRFCKGATDQLPWTLPWPTSRWSGLQNLKSRKILWTPSRTIFTRSWSCRGWGSTEITRCSGRSWWFPCRGKGRAGSMQVSFLMADTFENQEMSRFAFRFAPYRFLASPNRLFSWKQWLCCFDRKRRLLFCRVTHDLLQAILAVIFVL